MIIKVIIIILIIIYLIYRRYTRNIVEITEHNRDQYHQQIKDFEKKMQCWYDLGEDEQFKLDHGQNYYKFFDRQGKLHLFVYLDRNQVVGTCGAVLREIDNQKIWYLCDLKVLPEKRGNHTTTRMFFKGLSKIFHSRKAYCVNMGDGRTITKINQYIPFFKIDDQKKLYIYTIDSKTMTKVRKTIENQWQTPISFLSLRGIKDLILKSTDQPKKLYHVNRNNKYQTDIVDGYDYMFCCLEDDSIREVLTQQGITTDVVATVLSMNMKNQDLSFLQTSEI